MVLSIIIIGILGTLLFVGMAWVFSIIEDDINGEDEQHDSFPPAGMGGVA